jgi:translation elongation factor EF-Tu-like GTPase
MDNINDIQVNDPEFVIKQETLEEVAERIAENFKNVDFKAGVIYGIIEGAKWQQEQDKNKFREEEVEIILQQLKLKLKSGVLKWQEDFEFDLKEWFKQFKKI